MNFYKRGCFIGLVIWVLIACGLLHRKTDYGHLEKDNTLFFNRPCILPRTYMFDSSVTSLYKEREQLCPDIPPVVYINDSNYLDVNQKALEYFGLASSSDIQCKAEVIYRTHKDKSVGFREGINLTFPTQLASDFARVYCKNGSEILYDDILIGVSKDARVDSVPVQPESDDKPSVLLLIIDALSRSSALRTFTKTITLVKELGAHDFRGHMAIGPNSYPNVFPLITGIYKSSPNLTASSKYVDEIPMLWKNFSRKGYATIYGEDSQGGNIMNIHGKKGFRHQPVDHYMRPFWLAYKGFEPFKDDFDKKSRFYADNKKRARAPNPCLQTTSHQMLYINYMRKFVTRYRNYRKFMHFHISRVTHHSTYTYLPQADADFRDFFIWLKENGDLKNMIVFMFGDHGMHYGPIRETYVGSVEAAMPMFYVLVPEHLRQRFPRLEENLAHNTNRLTTHLDTRQALLDILKGHFERPTTGRYGISLFRKIPSSRSCTEAGISPELCHCRAPNATENKNASLSKKLADLFVEHINSKLDKKLCEVRELYRIRRVEILDKNIYYIVIDANPKTAIFETYCEVDEMLKNVNFRTIKRVDEYGDQAFCTDSVSLRPLCYCKR